MKIYMIICLIAVLFLKQSNHQLFWITGLNLPHFALSLASEEFIPQESNPVPVTQNVEIIEQVELPSKEESDVSQRNPSEDKTEKDSRDESDPDGSEDKIRVDVINNDRTIPIPTQVPVVSKEPDDSKPVDSLGIESDNLSSKQISENIEAPTSAVVNKGQSNNEIASEESLSEDVYIPHAIIPASNVIRNVSAELEKSKPTLPPQQEEEPIPSFLEWTQLQQKKLQELHTGGSGGHIHTNGGSGAAGASSGSGQHQNHQNGNNIVNVSTGTGAAAKKETDSSSATKNFASPDCGAKVIQSNPGSQNPNGVLSSSHDEYMLNKCGIPIWFVIELCEPLKIEKVSLGNLELFSSSPKEFELGISDRFPAREWNKLGPFPLPDSRSIHPLTLPATNSSTFGKFLKVNILSHHGTEHYCPLSVVKVNGKSEYEVLESETTHAEDEEETNKGEGSLFEEELDDSEKGKTNEKSVFGSATDAVINIVKKAAQVLVKTDSVPGSDLRANDSSSSMKSLKSGCQTMTHCLPSDSQDIEEINNLLSCNSSNLFPFLLRNLIWCGWESCHTFFSRSSIGLPWQIEGLYSSLFGGPNILVALCHFRNPLKKPCDVYVGNKTIIGADEVLKQEASYANISLNVGTDSAVVNTSTESEVVRATSTPPVNYEDQQPPPPIQIPTPPSDSVTEHQFEIPQIPAPPIVSENQVDDAQNQQTFQTTNFNSQQQKESVFVRLSNRIKTLERNQSLTASYLEELSRRFKKQNEDNHNLNEITKKQLNDTQEKSKYMENLLKTELQSVRRNLEDMRERLFTVQIQRSLLILICLVQFTLFVCIILWIKRRLRKLEKSISYGRELQEQPKQPSLGHLATLSGRKRANSDVTIGSVTAKVKKIKKKKKSLLPNADTASGCAFNFKATTNSSDIIDIVPRKENVNPLKPSIPSNTNANTTALTRPGPGSLRYDVKSEVNNSQNSSFGRFGILASPSPSEVFKQSSGSFSAPENSLSTLHSNNTIPSVNPGNNSASSSSSTISSGVQVLVPNSNNGSNTSKKSKKTSFKSLMPRIFDR